MCRYCPTGSNLQTVQIKIITDGGKIKNLSDLTVDYFMEMINQVDRIITEMTSQGREIPKGSG